MSTEPANPGADLKPLGSQTATTSARPPGPDRALGDLLPATPQPPSVGRRLNFIKRHWRVALLLVLPGVSIPIWRITTNRADAQRPAVAPALPVVAVARVERQDLYNELPIVAEFRPYAEVELHAKVSGYVQEFKVDFGDTVKAGQLLATLEVPELRDELNAALASQKRAEADYRVAHLAYTRLLDADRGNPKLFVQQELDVAEAKDHTTEATVAATKAEVEKYQALLSYTRITAPFDGVITARYADPGALIQSGTASATQSLPLVRLSDNYRLRLDFPVSVNSVKDVKLGDPADVQVQSLGDKSFTGTISRLTHRITDDTRTMITEIEVPNPNLELVPGMYAKVMLKVHKCQHVLSIPAEVVSADKEATLFVVNRQGELEQRTVTLGLETPTRREVKDGLKEGDLVLVGARADVQPGEKVQPKLITVARQ